jgi:hypothetical protein
MPVLPLIDALILLGWTSLFVGFLQKAVMMATSYRPVPFGMNPIDFLFVACVCLLFALTLAARTWVKAHEPELLARRRRARLAEAGYGADEMPDYQGNYRAPNREGAPEDPRRSAAGY